MSTVGLDMTLVIRQIDEERVRFKAEIGRLLAGIREIIVDAREQATANEDGFSYRHGNNLYNGGAASAQRDIADALEALTSNE